jgi:hypothetical protein
MDGGRDRRFATACEDAPYPLRGRPRSRGATDYEGSFLMYKRSTATALAVALITVLVAPQMAAADSRVKHARSDGSAPAQWNQAKPKAVAHPDVAPPSAGGNGDGYNSISFSKFDSGDIVVVLGTLTGHAGIFDRGRYASMYSYAVLSANKTPVSSVQYEQCIKYRGYPEAFGLWVPALDWCGKSALAYCRGQMGEPYNIASSKTDTTQWYCSKLVWAGWRWASQLDLDADGGYWVWPVDLVNSRYTAVFGHWI